MKSEGFLAIFKKSFWLGGRGYEGFALICSGYVQVRVMVLWYHGFGLCTLLVRLPFGSFIGVLSISMCVMGGCDCSLQKMTNSLADDDVGTEMQ